MKLEKNKKLLERLTRYNELCRDCQKRINQCNLNYKAWLNPDNNLNWYYSEKQMLDDIKRYENLFAWLEKRFNANLEKL